jgi:hypothetical protein
MMKWTGRDFFKEDFIYSYILHLGMGMAGFSTLICGLRMEWYGSGRGLHASHHPKTEKWRGRLSL